MPDLTRGAFRSEFAYPNSSQNEAVISNLTHALDNQT